MLQKIKTYCTGGPRELARRVLRRAGQGLVQASVRLESKPAFDLSEVEKQLLARNAPFRNCHAGKRCFVIGNGPSLKTQDLAPLANELTYVMSGFWKHPIVERWQPSYYCFADPLFFDRSEPMKKFFSSMSRRIHRTTYFVPLFAADQIRTNRLLPPDDTFYVAFRTDAGLDLTAYIPPAQSVSQLCIAVALYMGCSPIYLLGLDHDWLAQRGMDRHFYEGKTIDNHPIAHGDLSKVSYKLELRCQLQLWNNYEALLDSARDNTIQIFNATNGGFLDVFPRVSYENVIGQ